MQLARTPRSNRSEGLGFAEKPLADREYPDNVNGSSIDIDTKLDQGLAPGEYLGLETIDFQVFLRQLLLQPFDFSLKLRQHGLVVGRQD